MAIDGDRTDQLWEKSCTREIFTPLSFITFAAVPPRARPPIAVLSVPIAKSARRKRVAIPSAIRVSRLGCTGSDCRVGPCHRRLICHPRASRFWRFRHRNAIISDYNLSLSLQVPMLNHHRPHFGEHQQSGPRGRALAERRPPEGDGNTRRVISNRVTERLVKSTATVTATSIKAVVQQKDVDLPSLLHADSRDQRALRTRAMVRR